LDTLEAKYEQFIKEMQEKDKKFQEELERRYN